MSLLLIVGVMVFAAGLNYRYIVGAAAGRRCRCVYIVLMSAPYRRRRLLAFLDPGPIRSATASRSSSR